METNFKLKALKYKMKYLNLKNKIVDSQIAGVPLPKLSLPKLFHTNQ